MYRDKFSFDSKVNNSRFSGWRILRALAIVFGWLHCSLSAKRRSQHGYCRYRHKRHPPFCDSSQSPTGERHRQRLAHECKAQRIISDLLFYCFVDFGDGVTSIPTTFVIPSAIVAAAMAKTHRMWLVRPGKGGRAHRDTDLRRLVPDYTVYLGNDCGEYGSGWLDRYREA